MNSIVDVLFEDQNDIPLLQKPVYLICYIAAFFVVTDLVTPALMSSRKAFDLRLLMLIYNSLLFGITALGAVLNLLALIFYDKSWKCVINRSEDSFEYYVSLALVYVYLTMKTCHLFRFLISALRKKERSEIWEKLHAVCDVFIIYFAMIVFPGGIFFFSSFCDLFLCSFILPYLALRSVGKYFEAHVQWAMYIKIIALLHFVAILVHISYYFPADFCSAPQIFKTVLIIRSVVGIAVTSGRILDPGHPCKVDSNNNDKRL